MKLPNSESAIVAREKIADYLLNSAHPDNGGKAAFFVSCGFRQENWQIMADAFLLLARTAEVAKSVETFHGSKYIVEGPLETPSGKLPTVRTVWIVDRGTSSPRLVSAYPGQEY